MKILGSLIATISVLLATQVSAAPINTIAPGSLTGSQLVDFQDIPALNYNGIFTSGGVSFAERFTGETLSLSGDFDILSGTPTGPLSLAVGAANQNVVVIDDVSRVIAGLGPRGNPNFDAVGEGSLAVLFSSDQSEFGFVLLGGNDGSATVNFYRRDGSLIQSVVVNNLSNQAYAFSREGGLLDIAGISIFNTDLGGIGLDNLRFNVPSTTGRVPEPDSLALLGLALAAMAALRRRK